MKQNKTLQQQLYTLAFVDLGIKNILDSSTLFSRPEWLDTVFLLVFFFCIGWKLMLQRYTKQMIVVMGIFGMIFAFVSFKMSYYFLLFTFCGIAAVQNVDLKKTFKYTSVTKIFMILLHVVPYIVTYIVTPDQIDFIYRNGVKRQYFYIGHPNTFSMYVGWATLEFAYAFYDQLRDVDLLLIWIVNLIVYKFTDSNTSMIVWSICLVGFLAERAREEIVSKIVRPIARYGFAVCSVFFVVITMWFTSMPEPIRSWYLKLDDFFTGRLMYGAFTYETFGIAWLGNPNVHLSETTYFEGTWVDSLVFDNSYIYLFVYYGAIFLLIFSVAFILAGKKKSSDHIINAQNILIIGYTFYAIMENYAINAVLCFPVLFIGKRLYDIYEESINKKKLVGELK